MRFSHGMRSIFPSRMNVIRKNKKINQELNGILLEAMRLKDEAGEGEREVIEVETWMGIKRFA